MIFRLWCLKHQLGMVTKVDNGAIDKLYDAYVKLCSNKPKWHDSQEVWTDDDELLILFNDSFGIYLQKHDGTIFELDEWASQKEMDQYKLDKSDLMVFLFETIV